MQMGRLLFVMLKSYTGCSIAASKCKCSAMLCLTMVFGATWITEHNMMKGKEMYAA